MVKAPIGYPVGAFDGNGWLSESLAVTGVVAVRIDLQRHGDARVAEDLFRITRRNTEPLEQ
ncbi:hypothetical protein Airi01_065390 [Actinoallomurus iriomotensis]|uniref:Uncharacterized protein n=1 Tax=Actinoallomurus iriomotensis TaxID=478107 RepID=A0A9W6RQI4_9ACTN|nr:hypothetical protein Airi01_065390 [Actinoallomurus iriomotensis]